jgi:hypothetical protein
MKKAVAPKKNKTVADVVPQKKQAKSGPVELNLADLKKVSGGLPRGGGGWALKRSTQTTQLKIMKPRGTW